jgi:small subunit ribosomal protein S1
MSRRRVTDPKELVAIGQEVRVRVIKVENDGKRISLSMKEFEADPWSDVEERYAPGTPFTGKIVRSTDFGFFVEAEPGLDGLVHVSQLPIGVKANDPTVAIGQTVSGWVREVDASKKRLSLSLREVAVNDPWENASQKYPIGRVVETTVDHVGQPGLFVQLEPGLVGLVPNSEIANDVAEGAKPGDKLVVRVMSVDPSRKRVSLSYDAAKAAAEREEYSKFMDEQREGEGESAMALAFRRAMEKKR